VNTCEWSGDGTTLATGSDDLQVHLYSSSGAKLSALATGHRNNVFHALFFPHRTDALVTTAADGEVRLLNVAHGGTAAPARGTGSGSASELLFARRSSGFGMKLAFLPFCPFAFLSTHQDGRVRLFDIREARSPVPASPAARGSDGSDDRIVVNLGPDSGGASDLAFQPCGTHMQFALGSDDVELRLFDLRALSDRGITPHASFMPKSFIDRDVYTEGISGLAWAPHGRHVVVSYRGADVYLLPVDKARGSADAAEEDEEVTAVAAVRRFRGRSNVRTFLKSVAFLCDGAFVTCGGDCGHVFVWSTRTGQLASRIRADDQVLNCVAPHPHGLPLMAVSGIDDDPKLVSTGTQRDADCWPRPHDRAAATDEDGDGGGSSSDGDGGDDMRAVNTTLLAALMQNGIVPPAMLSALLARARRRAPSDEDDDDEEEGDEDEEGEEDDEGGSEEERPTSR
jgi:WD repeat-containing protein 42A